MQTLADFILRGIEKPLTVDELYKIVPDLNFINYEDINNYKNSIKY